MITSILTGIALVVSWCLIAGGVGLVGLFLWMFLAFPIWIVITENIKADSFETWLEGQPTKVTTQTVGKFTFTKTTYQIPAGVAMLKLINLANKKKLTESELAFTNELVETLNSIETLGYSVESLK